MSLVPLDSLDDHDMVRLDIPGPHPFVRERGDGRGRIRRGGSDPNVLGKRDTGRPAAGEGNAKSGHAIATSLIRISRCVTFPPSVMLRHASRAVLYSGCSRMRTRSRPTGFFDHVAMKAEFPSGLCRLIPRFLKMELTIEGSAAYSDVEHSELNVVCNHWRTDR